MISQVSSLFVAKQTLRLNGLSFAAVGRRGQAVVVERVHAERPDSQPYQAGHRAPVVLGDDAHLDDPAEEGVAERKLADHGRQVVRDGLGLHGSPQRRSGASSRSCRQNARTSSIDPGQLLGPPGPAEERHQLVQVRLRDVNADSKGCPDRCPDVPGPPGPSRSAALCLQ